MFCVCVYYGQFVCVRVSYFVFCVVPVCYSSVDSAIECLARLVSEMTCYVSSGTLNQTHSHLFGIFD